MLTELINRSPVGFRELTVHRFAISEFLIVSGRKSSDESLLPTEKQVNSALNISDTKFLGQQNVSGATTSLDQVTTTERPFWFGERIMFVAPSQNNATIDNTETKFAFNDTTATAAASANFTEMTAETSANQTVDHTAHTRIIFMKDMDHSHHHFNVSFVDPFSKEINGSRYKYLLAATLEGIHSK